MHSRELDAIIATYVMGWVHNPPGIRGLGWLTSEQKMIGDHALPAFSTDIAAAWRVVERITRVPQSQEEAERAANTKFGYWFEGAHLWAYSSAEAAHAICIAALVAIGYFPQSAAPRI